MLRMQTPLCRLMIIRAALIVVLALGLLGAQRQSHIYRIGVVHQGGAYSDAVEGLRDGLKELGFEDGKQVVLDVRDANGNLKTVGMAAKALEAANVDLIVSVASSTTVAVKGATQHVPIVFYAGTDPVKLGLAETFGRPGGRLTGLHGQYTDLTAKRLELLKELVPGIQRAIVFYNPDNVAAVQSLMNAREAARNLKVVLVERPVASVGDLHTALRALRPGEVDAIADVADAMVTSQAKEVIDTAIAKKLPMMATDVEDVAVGALAGYSESYRTIGKHLARYVQRVLMGEAPGGLPIEQLDRLHFVINLKTAKAIGLTIPPALLTRADRLIE